jgi:hypothetical protein
MGDALLARFPAAGISLDTARLNAAPAASTPRA